MEPLADLLTAVPSAARPFADTEYSLPVHLALFGGVAEIDTLVRLLRAADSEVGALAPALALAEAIESVAVDRDDYFLSDARTRSLVFTERSGAPAGRCSSAA